LSEGGCLIILQFDIGNTRLKWRKVTAAKELLDRGYGLSGQGYGSIGQSDFWKGVEALQISSVGSEQRVAEIVALCRAHAPSASIFIARSESLPKIVSFAYSEVGRMGVDRCLALIALKCLNDQAQIKADMLVVDAGSALTADYLSSDGAHLGGYIMCGLEMMKSALVGSTSKIRPVREVSVSGVPGSSTESCVAEGVTFMFQAAADRLVRQAIDAGYRVVITGGDGPLLGAGYDASFVSIHQDLVFEGLFYASEGAPR
jgi:type III pantothenate kinase